MRRAAPMRRFQEGAATLLVALVLTMALTVVTLSVARTHLVEQRVASNQHWHTRLSLLTEAGLAQGLRMFEQPSTHFDWRPDNAGHSVFGPVEMNNGASNVRTEVVWRRPNGPSAFALVQSTSERDDGSGLNANVSQFVRLLSVLSPAAETAPPLVVNGCLAQPAAGLDIRPLNADRDLAGDAIWLNRDSQCPPLSGIDVHNGDIVERVLGEDLWSSVFSVDRETFALLAAEQENLSGVERTYLAAGAEDLTGGRWLRSLGTPERPVAVYFPADLGCPEFAPGVQIHGVVFFDADCTGPIAGHSFELYGSLFINGNLDIGASPLRLNHIQIAHVNQRRLRFPVLRSVVVPGSWRDF